MMANTITSRITLEMAAEGFLTKLGVTASVKDELERTLSSCTEIALADGITISSAQTTDLFTGSASNPDWGYGAGRNPLGSLYSFTSVLIFAVINSGTAGQMTLFGASSNQWTVHVNTAETDSLYAGESFFIYSPTGYAVSSSVKNFKIDVASELVGGVATYPTCSILIAGIG